MVDNLRPGALIDLMLPARCRACGRTLAHGQFCEDCAADLPWNDGACPQCAQPGTRGLPCRACHRRALPFDGAWSAFRLETPVREAIHALKYRADFGQAQWLAERMAERLPSRPQLLIPVPLHARRLRRRGYNQALELARVLARCANLDLAATAVTRRRATDDQIGQTLSARRRNMRGAFEAAIPLTGMHVALIDDVMTTGATLEALARVCRRAGAVRVEAWSAARTP